MTNFPTGSAEPTPPPEPTTPPAGSPARATTPPPLRPAPPSAPSSPPPAPPSLPPAPSTLPWRRFGATIYEFGKTLLIAFILAQLIMVSVAQAFQVEQYSMEPTLLPHDRVLVNKFLYRFRPPQRGDVIVLRYPLNPQRNYIKRIIGLPGETLELKEGKVSINRRFLQEPYLHEAPQGNYGPFTIPADSVFVMGDNRNNSEDSRSFGPLKKSLIVGQALFIYWPPPHVHLLLGR